MAPIGFPYKLWKVLNVNDSALVKWSDDGTTVIVDEPNFDALSDKCYPTLLRVPSVVSLRRMFHLYCFNRTAPVDINGNELLEQVEYCHPYFVRGRWDYLHKVSPRYPRYPSFLRTEENTSYRNWLFPQVKCVKKRLPVAAPSTVHSSVRSLKKLSLYRLPYHLNLDDDVDGSPCRSSPVWPSPASVKSSDGGGLSHMLFEYQRPSVMSSYRREYGFDSVVDSLPTSVFKDNRVLTVKLRDNILATCGDNEPVVVDEDDDEEEEELYDNESGTDGRLEYDQPVVVGAVYKVKTSDKPEFADDTSIWFGLENQPCVEAITFQECNPSSAVDWNTVGENKVYADLVPIGTRYSIEEVGAIREFATDMPLSKPECY